MALKFDSNGWLVPDSDPSIPVELRFKTGKTSAWGKLTGGSPLGVVWHWTGGARSIWNWLMDEAVNEGRRASWHFSIGRDGKLAQHAPLNVATWHAGCDPNKAKCGTVLAYPNNRALPPIPTRSANSFFVGVEMENAGILRQQNGKWYAWPYAASLMNCSGTSQCSEKGALSSGGVTFEPAYLVPDGKVFKINGKAYETYTAAQVKTATALTQALKDALGWTRPEQTNYGHFQFIDQKLDPGDLWMERILPDIQKKVFGRAVGGVPVAATWAIGISALALAAGGGYWWWKRKGKPMPRLPKLPTGLQPQLAGDGFDGTVAGTMGLLNGILNGGFFTGSTPAGFGNLAELPPIDGSHSPFKRRAELVGTGTDPDGEDPAVDVTDSPRERKQSEKWECEWQPVGTGRPDGSGALAKSKIPEYMSEQLCTPIGEEVARHKPGYTKVVRIRKKTKQKYNKNYKKLLKAEKADKGYENRNHRQERQPNYKKRKTAWPKFENNPTFAARMKREERAAAKAAEAAALAAETKAKREAALSPAAKAELAKEKAAKAKAPAKTKAPSKAAETKKAKGGGKKKAAGE